MKRLSRRRLISHFHLLKAIRGKYKSGNAQEDEEEGVTLQDQWHFSNALRFHYHILSRKPGETVDGAMDYPACMG